jgi:hypothetical protein
VPSEPQNKGYRDQHDSPEYDVWKTACLVNQSFDLGSDA